MQGAESSLGAGTSFLLGCRGPIPYPTQAAQAVPPRKPEAEIELLCHLHLASGYSASIARGKHSVTGELSSHLSLTWFKPSLMQYLHRAGGRRLSQKQGLFAPQLKLCH